MSNPVIDSLGNKFWYKDGRLHREDGPAVEWFSTGKKWWCLHGNQYTESEFRMILFIKGVAYVQSKNRS